jgi:23S rRNA (uracil1939-C5)-methyltransferase
VVQQITSPAAERQSPFCKHFGVCGGCKWQMLPYKKQLEYKQQEAIQNLKRIGKVMAAEVLPIVGADDDRHYRNKLEFTFSNKRYLLPEEIGTDTPLPANDGALGFHVPRIFDKVIAIDTCYLMDDVNNNIRNTIRDFAVANQYSFYDIRQHTGWLRNIIIRHCTTGQLMVNIVFNYDDVDERNKLLTHVMEKVPAITTLLFTINTKWNDTIYDLTPQVYFGNGYVEERLENFVFKISPQSFFQTNTKQAEKLYTVARSFAGLTGKEVVYDLYCGTGSIGIFVSEQAKKVIGVEVIANAVEDAKINAALNNITHAHFFAGDVIKICNDEFFATHGKPDVVITDPPRAGMHEKLVHKLLEMEAPKIVYVSCNTATQARDVALLAEKYTVEKIQAVDMFPHTHHIECVALLKLK